MVVTGATCEAQIRHTLGIGADGALSPGLDALQIANEAGHTLMGLRDWRFGQGGEVELDFVSGQEWVALPEGIAQITAVRMANGLVETIEVVSLQDILEWRTSTVRTPLHYWVAISYGQVDGRPTPRLEIYPTPDADSKGKAKLFYRAGWSDLTSSDSIASVPAWLEPLYLLLLRAVARGYEDEDVEDMGSRVARVRQSHVYQAAVRHDVRIQPDYGRLSNGMAGSRSSGGWEFLRWGSLAGPS